jgi:SAM-dependent methyltransferase
VNNVRRVIPGGDLQLEVMMRLVESIGRPVQRFLDLGCGSGTLGAVLLQHHPDAAGVFVDFSPAMIEAARENLAAYPAAQFESLDYADPAWAEAVRPRGPFDVIVSGFSIHHQPDDSKRRIYREIFDLLAPGGVFVNVEHVKPESPIVHAMFEEHFVDNLYAQERQSGGSRTRDQIRKEFVNREDTEANILAPVQEQVQWLREIGYTNTDCFLQIYELAVFAGTKRQ